MLRCFILRRANAREYIIQMYVDVRAVDVREHQVKVLAANVRRSGNYYRRIADVASLASLTSSPLYLRKHATCLSVNGFYAVNQPKKSAQSPHQARLKLQTH